jgi:hypothetical protein
MSTQLWGKAMTIQITAYQALQPLFVSTDEELEALRREMFVAKDPNLVVLVKHPLFPERADYFPSGFFRSTGNTEVSARWNTSSYHDFKNLLAEKWAGRPLPAIFEEPLPSPFFELLYFVETGPHYMFGPKTSEKLARDFGDNDGRASSIGGAFYEIYREMHQAFKMASRSGAVRLNAS